MNRRERKAWNDRIDAAQSPREQRKLIEQYADAESRERIANMREGKRFDASGGTKRVRGGDGPASPEGPHRTSTRGNNN